MTPYFPWLFVCIIGLWEVGPKEKHLNKTLKDFFPCRASWHSGTQVATGTEVAFARIQVAILALEEELKVWVSLRTAFLGEKMWCTVAFYGWRTGPPPQVLFVKNDNSKLASSRMTSNKKACCFMWALGLWYQAKASRSASLERMAASGPPASVLQEALLGDRDQMSQTEVVKIPVASQECCSQ